MYVVFILIQLLFKNSAEHCFCKFWCIVRGVVRKEVQMNPHSWSSQNQEWVSHAFYAFSSKYDDNGGHDGFGVDEGKF
jgi:hypothetical protein